MSEEPPGKKRKDNSPLISTCSSNDQSDGRSGVKLMKTLRGLIDLSPPDFRNMTYKRISYSVMAGLLEKYFLFNPHKDF